MVHHESIKFSKYPRPENSIVSDGNGKIFQLIEVYESHYETHSESSELYGET